MLKKTSPNRKLTVYLGKRDFVDHTDLVDPVDGVVLVESRVSQREESLRDSHLCLLLRPGGPGCTGPDFPQGHVHGQHAVLPTSPRGQEAPDAATGAPHQEAGRACLPFHLRDPTKPAML